MATRGTLALLAAVGLATLFAGPAAAQQGPLTIREMKPKEDAEDPRPWFRAILGARPGLVAKDFVLQQLSAQPPVSVPAKKVVNFKDSDDAMSLVILLQGNYVWMGNETYVDPTDPEVGAIYEGAFQGLGPAIETLAGMGPARSRAALIVYSGEVIVKAPMGDASALNTGALGRQQDYQEIGKPFVAGLTEAWKMLTGVEEAENRKVLVVIGNGLDDSDDIAVQLRKAIDDLAAAKVEVYTIYYGEPGEEGPHGQQNLTRLGASGGFYQATTRSAFDTFAGNIAQLVGAKYYVDFPGDGVVFDGEVHEFTVAVGGEPIEPPVDVQVSKVEAPPEKSGSLWWLWLLLLLLLVIVIIVIVVVLKKRRQAQPAPMPEIPVPEVAPPPPAGPQRTIMLGVGGSEDSMPIVGWVVPLAGPNQYQTFKLLQGSTKLGTGGAAHIVVGDSFMSTEHAEIVCSAVGFILNDLGSTNGTFVNDRRVGSHELVDNDVFRLGQTDFKFKSIN